MATTMYSEMMRLNPLRYLPLADAVSSAAAKDVSSKAQNGAVTGTVTFGQSPLIQASSLTCASFAGTANIAIPATALPGGAAPFTLMAWLKTASAGGFQGIVTMGSGFSNQMIGMYIRNGTTWTASDAAADLVTHTGVSNNTKYFAALTYDGITLRFYLNGAPLMSVAFTLNISQSTSAYIADDVFLSEKFNGRIAHPAIIGSMLTADQISWIYNVGQGAGVLQGNHRAFGRMA